MSSSKWLAVFAAACVLVLGLAACGGGDSSSSSSSTSEESSESESGGGAPASEASGEIAGAGSTAQQASQEAWIAEFENANGGATISYDGVGSGGGREQFISGGGAFQPGNRELERPGDRQRERRGRTSGHADRPGQPLRRVGHDRKLHRLPLAGRAQRVDARSER